MPDLMTANSPKSARFAVLDIGSNSIRLVIYDVYGASFCPIYNEKVLAGLGRSLRETACLDPKGWQIARAAIIRFKRIVETLNVDQFIIGATAALRDANDASGFIKEIENETGLLIKPVSGPKEAWLSAMGLLSVDENASGIAADLGGASLELIRVEGGKPGKGLSLPIGPFQRLGHDLRDADFDREKLSIELSNILAASELQSLKPENKPLYLIGGAWRNLFMIYQNRTDYPLHILQNFTVTKEQAFDLARWAGGDGRQTVMNWPNMSSRRAETLPYSGVMLEALLDVMNPSEVVISETGLREGLVYDAISMSQRSRDSMWDGCADLARGNLVMPDFAKPLSNFLAPFETCLPPVFELEKEARLRYAACLLTGVGKGRHEEQRPTMVFDEILYAPIAGLSHKARAYLALILFRSYSNRSKTPDDKVINALLTPKEMGAASVLGSAIRLAVVSCGRSPDLLPDFSLCRKSGDWSLIVTKESKDLLTARVKYRLKKLNESFNRYLS